MRLSKMRCDLPSKESSLQTTWKGGCHCVVVSAALAFGTTKSLSCFHDVDQGVSDTALPMGTYIDGFRALVLARDH